MSFLQDLIKDNAASAEDLRAQYETYVKESAAGGNAPDDPEAWAKRRLERTTRMTPAPQPNLSYDERRELRRAFLRIMCGAGHGTFMENVEALVSAPGGTK